jgi:hypothetical protein
MMQEIAEASVESILTGLDSSDGTMTPPDTPPTKDLNADWYSPSATSTPFSSKPSWSFCETETNSGSFARGGDMIPQPLNQREISSSVYSSGEDMCGIPDGGMPEAAAGLCTTVMLRNIPNKYTRSGLLAALVERGFDPTSDCNNLYLPMDAGSGCNLGYAFLNFTSHEKALSFMKQFDGCRLPSAGSRKVCSVVWANKQGLFQHSNPPTSKEQTTPAGSQMAMTEGVPTCKIFVGGLPVTTTEADLIEYFSKFGHVREASIVVNRQTGASRGFGFCEFVSPDGVDRVQMAQARRPHSINCRIVSVRPYNSTQYSPETLMMAPQPQQPPTMTFLMGNGVYHCPTNGAPQVAGGVTYPQYTSSYSHPLLAPPTVPGIHSFMSY